MLAIITRLCYYLLMDFIFDIFFGLLFGLFQIIMPEYKFKKWQKALLILSSILLLISSIGCFIAGVHLLNTNNAPFALSISLTSIGGILLLGQCILFFVLIGYTLKQNARKNENNDINNSENQ